MLRAKRGQRGISIYEVRPLKWSVFSGELSPFRIMAKLIAYTATQSPSIHAFIHMYSCTSATLLDSVGPVRLWRGPLCPFSPSRLVCSSVAH